MLLNILQLTSSLSFNHQLSLFYFLFFIFLLFSTFLPLFQFPISVPSPFSSLPISLFLSPFLLGLCCPQGVWDRLGDSLYAPLSWPELPSWGSFDGVDGVGDYSSCSLGRILLSHSSSSSSSSITCIYRHIHIWAQSWKITGIFSTFYTARLWCCCWDTVKFCSSRFTSTSSGAIIFSYFYNF